MNRQTMCVAVLVFGLVLGVAAVGSAAKLDSSQNLNGGPVLDLTEAGQDVTRDASGVYDFNNKNGDGATGDAVTPPGMDMQGFKLSTTDGSTHIQLSLNGGDMSGTAATALTTKQGASHGRNISITNVGGIAIGGLDTRTDRGYRWGGNVTIGSDTARAGNVQVGFIYTYPTASTGYTGGEVSIYGSGDVGEEVRFGACRA